MKVGIFAPWGKGDLCNASGVFKYKDTLWPGASIVWFASPENVDLLAHNPMVSEVRSWPFPWAAIRVPWLQARDSNGALNGRKTEFKEMADLDLGFFPTPWQETAHSVPLALVPKKIFGLPPEAEWHPYLMLCQEDINAAKMLISRLPHKRTIMFETQSLSDQSISPDLARHISNIVFGRFGGCNLVFSSKSALPVMGNHVLSLSGLTVRQCVAVYNLVDAFIGVSSGVSCATCCWAANSEVVRVEFCSHPQSSTVHISRNPRKSRVAFTPEDLIEAVHWMPSQLG